jgi:hypothetical protein
VSGPRPVGPARLLATLALCLLLASCGHPMLAVARVSAARTPESPTELERLVVTDVPSRLPRLPDAALTPPAGQKTVDDVARYSKDPDHERQVLAEYGYRFGWERFWGTGRRPTTSVFVYQFRDWTGAGTYARDLAGNDAEYYQGMLQAGPADLPEDCWSLTVDTPHPAVGLDGPASFAWCAHGVFSVAVTAVSDTTAAAAAEVRAVLRAQLQRLPVG